MSKESKSREYWMNKIQYKVRGQMVYFDKADCAPECFQLIEYSAYDSALNLIEEMAGALMKANNDYDWYEFDSTVKTGIEIRQAITKYRKWKEGMK